MLRIDFKLFLIIAIYNFIACKSQTLPLNTFLEDITNGAHVKDLNNELTPYIGTYKTNYEGNEITLYITKENDRIFIMPPNKQYYQDALIVKYTVKNSSGVILQDTKNLNSLDNDLHSIRTRPLQNTVVFIYSGTNCRVGGGFVYLSKINASQISWSYFPEGIVLSNCPPGSDLKIYLPDTENLIFTKQ